MTTFMALPKLSISQFAKSIRKGITASLHFLKRDCNITIRNNARQYIYLTEIARAHPILYASMQLIAIIEDTQGIKIPAFFHIGEMAKIFHTNSNNIRRHLPTTLIPLHRCGYNHTRWRWYASEIYNHEPEIWKTIENYYTQKHPPIIIPRNFSV